MVYVWELLVYKTSPTLTLQLELPGEPEPSTVKKSEDSLTGHIKLSFIILL